MLFVARSFSPFAPPKYEKVRLNIPCVAGVKTFEGAQGRWEGGTEEKNHLSSVCLKENPTERREEEPRFPRYSPRPAIPPHSISSEENFLAPNPAFFPTLSKVSETSTSNYSPLQTVWPRWDAGLCPLFKLQLLNFWRHCTEKWTPVVKGKSEMSRGCLLALFDCTFSDLLFSFLLCCAVP